MTQNLSAAEQALRDAAREYHRNPSRGKISVTPTKPLSNQRDLSLAYSPGVAYPCLDIQADPSKAFDYTSRGNLVGVITNGTAVLGLGDIGPLAGKPVMEGKGCLFKKFAGVDVFDIELAERDPDKLIEIIASLEPTLGGINLEDIKAPECFYIERELSKRMNIPVFHDDQHGTAIISSAALLNGLELVGKQIGDVKVAVSGAGAAAIACLNVMVGLGVKRENIFVCDSKGVIYEGRPGGLDESKAQYAQKTDARTLADAVNGADVFLGCSAPGVLTAEMVKTMGPKPIILALANPEPEIRPELAKAVRPDCIIATGRSDYPNQVNNVLCFPYIFRGALDCGATKITEAMKLACVHEIANLAKAETSAEVAAAYAGKDLQFGPDYIIPKPFDPRLMPEVASIVAQAAMDSGVASRPILDMDAYRDQLQGFVFRSGLLMKPVFDQAARAPKRVVFAEGETEPQRIIFSERFACPVSGFTIPEIEPRLFSFNAPFGACPVCDGLGVELFFDPRLIVPDESLPLLRGAITPWSKGQSPYYRQTIEALAKHFGFDKAVRWRDLPDRAKEVLLYGSGGEEVRFRYDEGGRVYEISRAFEGVIPNMERRYRETDSSWSREDLERYQNNRPCGACHGFRLKPEALAVRIGPASGGPGQLLHVGEVVRMSHYIAER